MGHRFRQTGQLIYGEVSEEPITRDTTLREDEQLDILILGLADESFHDTEVGFDIARLAFELDRGCPQSAGGGGHGRKDS